MDTRFQPNGSHRYVQRLGTLARYRIKAKKQRRLSAHRQSRNAAAISAWLLAPAAGSIYKVTGGNLRTENQRTASTLSG